MAQPAAEPTVAPPAIPVSEHINLKVVSNVRIAYQLSIDCVRPLTNSITFLEW